MARSRRQRPFAGITTASSEKDDKVESSRCVRRTNAQILKDTRDDASLKSRQELRDSWSMCKDGKRRFDPRKDPSFMRK